MNTYVVLMRGINVGGKNKVSMKALKQYLEAEGFENVATYINSGNVILQSRLGEKALRRKIEAILPVKFTLDSSIIRVLAVRDKTFETIVKQAPQEFGMDTAQYRYYVIFLMGVSATEALSQIVAREGIDKVWQGNGAIYYRLPSLTSPNATKSYLNKVTQQPIYQAITIRNWNTTTKLLAMLRDSQK